MKLDGRRVSGNVRDIRGKGGKAAGIGIGGVIVIGLITLLMGGNPLEVLNMVSTGEGYSETYTPQRRKKNSQLLQSRFWRAPRMSGRIYSSRWVCATSHRHWSSSPEASSQDAAGRQLPQARSTVRRTSPSIWTCRSSHQ